MSGNGKFTYEDFLATKQQRKLEKGFEPLWIPDFLFDFQKVLAEWSIRVGRGGLFASTGLGKTPIQLVWSENVIRKTNGNVLILTPLAVSYQTVREGKKFGIKCTQSQKGKVYKGITVTNYERLGYFSPSDFVGVVVDESSAIKAMDGKRRKAITEFLSKVDYRLLCTATPAPNDFMELGTSAEALGVMEYNQMLAMFFINDGETTSQWRLKGHGRREFWRWVSTWARAVRKPSDLGFEDGKFNLPPLNTYQHEVKSKIQPGCLLVTEAMTLADQRQERRSTLRERCEKVAELAPKNRPFIAWCHLNAEGDLLTKLIPDAVQVAGSDRDEVKEERLDGFARGKIRVLVTKPKIGGWGLNLQHCSDLSFFPSHSFESWFQCVRRCWRFGQKRPVNVHLVTSQAESRVLANMMRKERQANQLFDGIIREMNEFQMGKKQKQVTMEEERLPAWL